jgi:hypothetical protein
MDDHEHVKKPERGPHRHEEVASDDRLGVILEKRRPALIARLTGPGTSESNRRRILTRIRMSESCHHRAHVGQVGLA